MICRHMESQALDAERNPQLGYSTKFLRNVDKALYIVIGSEPSKSVISFPVKRGPTSVGCNIRKGIKILHSGDTRLKSGRGQEKVHPECQ